MKYLLDVNVLVAWGWSDHVEHERTATWIAAARKQKTTTLLTSAIPELGFMRVSVQRTQVKDFSALKDMKTLKFLYVAGTPASWSGTSPARSWRSRLACATSGWAPRCRDSWP